MTARGFDIQRSFCYRDSGETARLRGQSENISHPGVPFWADQGPEVDSGVDMNLDIPTELGGETGAGVIYVAKSRAVPPASLDAQVGLAARMLDYRPVLGKRKRGH